MAEVEYKPVLTGSLLREYRARWDAVAEIEVRELAAQPLVEKWRLLNALYLFAVQSGMSLNKTDNDLEAVRSRWARLRAGVSAYHVHR